MATGAPGTQGIWQYGEDDSEATFSALLNKVASTTNTQIGVDRGRISSLEGTRPGTSGKPLQFAAGGADSSTSGNVTVTFPSGRFAFGPVVHLTSAFGTNAVVMPYIATLSSTSFSFSLYTTTGTRVAQYVNWTAVQMTSSGSVG